MQVYKTRIRKIPGTQWPLVSRPATQLYKEIKRSTKRRPYVRSAYFNKEKIFLELFWRHLYEKSNIRDKIRRIKYFPCAIDLLRHTRIEPTSKENPNRAGEMLHRFVGITPENELFIVQVKEDKRTSQKWLISVFPSDN